MFAAAAADVVAAAVEYSLFDTVHSIVENVLPP